MKVIKPPLIYQFEKALSILIFSWLSYFSIDLIINKPTTSIDSIIFTTLFILFSIVGLLNLFELLNNYPKILIDDQYLIYINLFQCKYIVLKELEYQKISKFKIYNIIIIKDQTNKFIIPFFGFLKSHLKLVEKELEAITSIHFDSTH